MPSLSPSERLACASPGRYAWLVLLGLALLMAPGAVSGQPIDIPETWGGDFWSRPRLSGSWGGFRDELGKKGVVFDADLLLTPQWVMTGGRDTDAEFWGNAEYTLNVDTGKAGLWPGGFLKISANTGFGDNVLRDSAAIVPVNTPALLPAFGDEGTSLMNATFMQFLSPKFGLLAGKIFTIDANHGEFAGNYRTQFLNAGLVFPMNLALVPISAFGGGFVVLPWDGVVLSALLLDPSGTPENNDVSEAFRDGFLVLGSGQVTIKPFGLIGHQSLGYMWSDKEHFSLNQDPSNIARALLNERFPRLSDPGPILQRILERFFPQLLVPVQPANKENTTWAMFYGFDQFLWQPRGDSKSGIGLFFTFGACDGDANPIKYVYSMGIGGKGVVLKRPGDSFGLGWTRTEFSDNLVPLLRQQLDLGLEREDAIEMYYNAAITPWLSATLDLQIIDPALKRTLDSSGRLQDVNTAVVAGLRLYIRF
jgi:porin